MNRIRMVAQIVNKLPDLLKEKEEILADSERLRSRFTKDYPVSRITRLSLDEYVIGKGSATFCYRLEQEMDCLGRIRGATAFKFGVYYGKTKSDPNDQYRFAKHWGSTYHEAFTAVKSAILTLLRAAAVDNRRAIIDCPLSPMLKGKLLHIYFPDRYAPVYSKRHLRHFVTALDLPGDFECETDMQRALMEYRDSWLDLKSHAPVLFMHFLYRLFGYPDKSTVEEGTDVLPTLNEATSGAKYIAALPLAPHRPTAVVAGCPDLGVSDYGAHAKRLKRIGDRGEAIVLAMERSRLYAAGKPELARRIRYVAQENEHAGYDILSYDDSGAERPIEVKATNCADTSNGFFLTANELEHSIVLPNYHIYLVFSAMSTNPRVLPVSKPNLLGPGYVTTPVVYYVTPLRP